MSYPENMKIKFIVNNKKDKIIRENLFSSKEAPEVGAIFKSDLEAIRYFAETYTERTDTFFCKDLKVTFTVLVGLAAHKLEFGSPLCPCRHYENKQAEVNLAYWNCPCIPMRERKECHCMLFLTLENSFCSETQKFSNTDFQNFCQDNSDVWNVDTNSVEFNSF